MNTQQRMRDPDVQLNVRLPLNLNQALKEQAQREDRSISRVVRRALLQYLERERTKQQPAV